MSIHNVNYVMCINCLTDSLLDEDEDEDDDEDFEDDDEWEDWSIYYIYIFLRWNTKHDFLSMDSVKLSCKCSTNLLYIFVAFLLFFY